MSTDHNVHNQANNGLSVRKGRTTRAFVWEYFEKITGDDGLPKTRCTNCNKVYNSAPSTGTSNMRRHLRKCCPQPLTQLSPTQTIPLIKTDRSSDELADELADEARAAKKLKSVMVENLQTKTDRELVEFIWMNKRNVGLLEQKLPYKAIAIKEAIKCYEDEIDRRANLHRLKENGSGHIVSIMPVKVEADNQLDARYENGSVVGGHITDTHADVNQKRSPHCENEEVGIKVEIGGQSGTGNEFLDEYLAEEERVRRLQIVPINGDGNQTPVKQQTAVSILPQDINSELKKVSSVLSILTSQNTFYTPQHNPLDQDAENAKILITKLLQKDFESVIESPDDEQNVKSCIQILLKNLHKIPMFQGKVIQTLDTEFESACKNWTTWHNNIHKNISLEVQESDKLAVLQVWQEKDMELETKIADVDTDIIRLKGELREKELTRENLVKQKTDLFDESKISINEAKKLLEEMVSVKLQSDVAIDKMKEVSSKWEKMRENFIFK